MATKTSGEIEKEFIDNLRDSTGKGLGDWMTQVAASGITKRNDRLLAVPLLLHQDRPPYELADMPSAELKDIEDFFVAYQAADCKETKILGRFERSDAERLVREAFLP